MIQGRYIRLAPVLVASLWACNGKIEERIVKAPLTTTTKVTEDGALLRGRPVSARWSRVPRFRPAREGEGIRALPDAEFTEWSGVRWLGQDNSARVSSTSPSDLDARLAFASYGSGLSLAVEVRDDDHLPATAASAFGSSDHVEVRLWVGDEPALETGLHFRVGTVRQLVDVISPDEPWRGEKISAAGAAASQTALGGGGYRIEARVPLMVLTPLPSPRIAKVKFRVTIHDADRGEGRAAPALRFEGTAVMDPEMQVPEAVQKRGSVRVCVGSRKEALWGYENGWRCAIPHNDDRVSRDDTRSPPPPALGYARVPTPPRIVWIRERVLFVNFIGVRTGVAALLDEKDAILSVMPLGVVGAEDPGNPRVSESGTETLRLPDGTYAVAVTHAYPAKPGALGGRCAAGHRVFLSLVALRGCYKSTPEKPAPDPEFTPYLEEVFRVLLEDCETSVANDWSLSRDRRTIKVHSSLYPSRPSQVWIFRDGSYRFRDASNRT